ncbi:MAG: hypothetical protein KF721_13330 [Ignavibacteriaceae bacterium]|nr:hypothetical protein [Ignavibacteriaceae bacterium]
MYLSIRHFYYGEVTIKILSQKSYKDYNRSDVRCLGDDFFQEPPKLLPSGKNKQSAFLILKTALGITTESEKLIITPVQEIVIKPNLLLHIVQKRNDAREKYANFIIPTLINPFEVYNTEYEDGFRNQYIGLFKGTSNILVVIKTSSDGNLFWNMMHTDKRIINKHRVGELIYYTK